MWLELSNPGLFPITSLGLIEFLAEWKMPTMLCSIGKLSGIANDINDYSPKITIVLTKGQATDDLYLTDAFHTRIGK